jgi:hypothetical protein
LPIHKHSLTLYAGWFDRCDAVSEYCRGRCNERDDDTKPQKAQSLLLRFVADVSDAALKILSNDQLCDRGNQQGRATDRDGCCQIKSLKKLRSKHDGATNEIDGKDHQQYPSNQRPRYPHRLAPASAEQEL